MRRTLLPFGSSLPAIGRCTRALAVPAVVTALLSACGGGGGGGGGSEGSTTSNPPAVTLGAPQLAVLIAQGDATSEAIGRAYQAARGIPEANMVRLALPPAAAGSDTIGAADFNTLKAAIDARLTSNVQATLVTWSQPSRVQGSSCAMSITSALAFGYDAAYCAVGCARTQASPLYASTSNAPWADLRLRPSMMLGTTTLADAQALIARGVAAERSFGNAAATGARGTAWLLRTSDADRNRRWPDFVQLAASSLAGITMRYVDNSAGAGSDVLSGQDAVMFYFTGLPVVAQLASNRYLPGAVGDSLSSTGGVLPGGNGQTTVRDWLQAGLTGSYGTVEEPCNYTEKFPRATVLLERYGRGDALIEAYWKSVEQPGQGLFVGDPLARPWGR